MIVVHAVINAENAVHKSTKFTAMAQRTREEYLKDLALNHTTSTTLENSSKTSTCDTCSERTVVTVLFAP